MLSAYGWTGGHSLDWGAGGPQAWPQARPYRNEPADQDQRGFRVSDWYCAIARSVLSQDVPLMLLQSGLACDPAAQCSETFQPVTPGASKTILQLLAGEKVSDPMFPGKTLAPISTHVIACNFWLLGADLSSPFSTQAWYTPDGKKKELAKWLQAWRASRVQPAGTEKAARSDSGFPIRHYLLLPSHEWGVSDWYLEITRPFVKKYLPTVGFSPFEAERAAQVTVIGNPQNYPDDLMRRLTNAGCKIDQIYGDGTKIATELAER